MSPPNAITPMDDASPYLARLGAAAAIVGAPVLLIATLVHPMSADPNDAAAAFVEYAADPIWIASHLGQFAGVALLGVALVALGATLDGARAFAGLVQADTGFSSLAMTVSMSSSSI